MPLRRAERRSLLRAAGRACTTCVALGRATPLPLPPQPAAEQTANITAIAEPRMVARQCDPPHIAATLRYRRQPAPGSRPSKEQCDAPGSDHSVSWKAAGAPGVRPRSATITGAGLATAVPSPGAQVRSGRFRTYRPRSAPSEREDRPSPPDTQTPAKPSTRKAIPQAVKVAVAARDRTVPVQSARLGHVGMCGSTEEPHYDHIIPWSKGGTDSVRNLQILCGRCNRRKGADNIT